MEYCLATKRNREETYTSNNVDESQTHYVDPKEPDAKDYINMIPYI